MTVRTKRRYRTTPAAQTERGRKVLTAWARKLLPQIGIFEPGQLREFTVWTDLLRVEGREGQRLSRNLARYVFAVAQSGDHEAIANLFLSVQLEAPYPKPLSALERSVIMLRWGVEPQTVTQIASYLGMDWHSARDLVLDVTGKLLARALYIQGHDVPPEIADEMVEFTTHINRAMDTCVMAHHIPKPRFVLSDDVGHHVARQLRGR